MKGQLSFQLVLIVLASIVLIAAAIAFVPKTLDYAKDKINNIMVDFGLKTEEIPEIVIDEERIEEGTKKTVESIPNDPKSVSTFIIKQSYTEGGWNLEVPKSIFQKAKETYTGPGWLLLMLMSGEAEPLPVLENVPLLDILNSDKVRGIITINGRQYVHTINKEKKISAEDINAETPDLIWYKNPVIENGIVTSGIEITAEEVRNLLLAELYEESK